MFLAHSPDLHCIDISHCICSVKPSSYGIGLGDHDVVNIHLSDAESGLEGILIIIGEQTQL